MRGFQPQHFADGGLVQGFKRVFGMDEERNARVAAYRAQQAQEKAQQQAAAAPAPAPAPQRAITEYAGDSAMKRREKAAGLADGGTVKPRGFKAGGLIRGPGTGTSDSIETEKRPGTFIMPADSTQAIGPEALEEMGEVDNSAMEEQGEEVPVRLSNGEFEVPPEKVQALGEAVLTVMRDATHKPVRGFAPQAEPEEPRQFFADGGMVKPKKGFDVEAWTQQQEQQRAAGTQAALAAGKAAMDEADTQAASRQGQKSPVGMTPDQAYRAGLITSPTPIGNTAATPAPQRQPGIFPNNSPDAGANIYGASNSAIGNAVGKAAGFVADAFPGTTAAIKGSAQDAKDAYQQGGIGAAVGQSARVAATPLIGLADDVASGAARVLNPAANALKTFATGDATPIGQTAATPSAPSVAKPQVAPSTAPAGASTAGAVRGSVNPPTVDPAGQSAAVEAGKQPIPGVYKHGPGQYSDNATGMNFPPGFTGQPSAQNLAAADNLARGFVPGGNASPGQAQAPAGIAAPTVRNSTNDWAARKQLDNMATAASSITNRPEWQSGSTTIAGSARGFTGTVDPQGKVAAYKAAVANDQALQQAQPGLDQTAMRENGGLQREAVQQQGGLQREQVQQAGANQRSARGFEIDRQRVGLEQQVRGFDIREGQRKEKLYERYDTAKTPEEKAAVAQQIRDLSGKQAESPWKVQVTPTTKNADGSTTEGSVIRYNQQTGQAERVDLGQGGRAGNPAPQDASQRRVGATYALPNGKMGQWTEKGWLLVG